MTLPLSGSLSMTMITNELGVGQASCARLGSAIFRELAGVPSGAIEFSDFYGKTYIIVYPTNILTWGRNGSGSLGDNSTANRSSPGTTAGGGTTWCQVSGGSYHTAAVKTDGTLWTWGYNGEGILGNNSSVIRSSPGTVAGEGTTWRQVSAGRLHTAAVKTDGTLWTWGANSSGELGTNTTISRSSPGTTASGGTTWCQVSSGGSHTAAVKTDGTLWTWGSNLNGVLGTGNSGATSRSSPGTTAGGGITWCQVSSGNQHTAAIKTDGTLWTWGEAGSGRLGHDSTTDRSSPGTTAGGGTTWCQVSAGLYHTAAIKTDGTLWTWGNNGSGRLGNNSVVSRLSPVTTAGGGINWCQASADGANTAAVKTDGTLWTWGFNFYGTVGDNTTANRSSPVTPSGGGTSWCQVSTGSNYFTAAVKSIE